MRTTRVERFKKLRRKKIKKFIIYTFILPTTFILLGYLFTTIIIIPIMTGNN
ncbi:hypothetical protein M972_111073 [Acetivibrio thermocellus AD2]|jgi:hypothetical protein|uniref:Sugar ABC transporter permease n=1 Tax=Acetivibrio thermocellus AD2 TaxID=1138384 RepID=A0AB36THJ1_ACETH|nr:hypothetical protein Clo1313_1028 [Acetivibrio thermocellus DSM 1313]ALX08034.1 hypothetical protein AD2_01039 [Acetivibrio thermocellus AD2]ANV75781.1 hypothetical protein LQRI_1040 [Acetivibrio thermocellus DSM 2360]EIC06054.1 hypothetical protein YSBL_0360 [Acetivibrio thermocellus YS]SOD26075.1 hypothetical protein SAMN04515622_2516 [Acetivibrio thermocellus]